MDKFNRALHGYDPDEVNAFLDQVINHVEKMVDEIKVKDAKIKKLEAEINSSANVREKLAQYERMEKTMNSTLFIAQKTSDQIKSNAYRESELIVDDAKKNANRIVNESLLKAEKIENEAITLKRNVTVYKRRLKNIIEEQLNMVDEIEKVDF
ncbi:MAG TPA: DivIVA domain-containing protein [Bacilli bacterium]|nr:DivIVA domain-containing protein [Bacilli bacterium]